MHILAISEIHLYSTVNNADLMVQGYKIFRKARTAHDNAIAFYIQKHLLVKLRDDLMLNET